MHRFDSISVSHRTFPRLVSICGIFLCGVGCTIAPINCAAPDPDVAEDAGGDVVVDAGTGAADAGQLNDAGTGIGDGGSAPSDAGQDAQDAGEMPDGGATACADSDSPLGSLVLREGYTLSGTAAIPDDVIAVASYVASDAEVHLAALRSGDLSVRDLGIWPELGDDTLLFSLVAEDDNVVMPFPSAYLAGNGSSLAAGYTAYDADSFTFPGTIAWWNGTDTSYLAAEGNYSAVMYDDLLWVNGLGAGDAGDASGVYGMGFENDALIGKTLATFPSEWNAYSGHNAVTSTGIALLGGFFSWNDVFSNHLIAVSADELTAAWSNNTTISLEEKPVVASGSGEAGDMLSVATMGADVAILRGVFGQTATGVFRIMLQQQDDDEVSANGDETPVLTTVDDCTPVHFVSTFASGLMVAVGNPGSMRLLRLSVAE